MKVWGMNEADIRHSVAVVSREHYWGNVIIDSGGLHAPPKRIGRAFSFCLRVVDSRAVGARYSASGRRTVAASWHAHRDIMRELFNQGATRIKTSLADYRSADDFERKHGETGLRNVGSVVNPAALASLSHGNLID